MDVNNFGKNVVMDAPAEKNSTSFFDKVRSFLDARYLSVLSLCWLIEKLINYKVWLPHPTFPTAPVAEILLALPSEVQFIMFYFSVWLMCCLIFQPRIKWALPVLLLVELCACMLDQNRWTPWEYEFIFIMAILVVNKKNNEFLQAAILFMLAGTYIYSGIHKFNRNFLYFDYTGILHTIFRVPLNVIHRPYIYRAGYLLALFEALLGLGLLFPTTQKKSAQFLIAMHMIIAGGILQNPSLYQYNLPIVPWNIANLFLLYVFFVLRSSPTFKVNWLYCGVNPLVILCFGILPLLSFWGLWEHSFSLKFYSGKFPPKLAICITDTSTTPDMRPYYSTDNMNVCKGATYVFVNDWAFHDINGQAYSEKRVLKVVKQFFIERHPNTHCNFYLVTKSAPPFKPTVPF